MGLNKQKYAYCPNSDRFYCLDKRRRNMTVLHLTDNDFEEKIIKSDKPSLVDFFAPWCGPCKMVAPVMDSLAEKYRGKIVIAKINIDEEQRYAGQFGVMSIPTVIIFNNGKEVDRQVGFPGEQGYIDMIEKAIK